ncbi:MAG: class I SAM-dependent methyltransferase [Treponema sp.]|nr:class I SAM-dependent methyltransferase [Treponema sp.]
MIESQENLSLDDSNDRRIGAFRNREVSFQYRARAYEFSLSLELFSSAGIDTGSRLLLKFFSDFLDRRGRLAAGQHLAGRHFADLPAVDRPIYSVLDSGCGVGVLGICAAGALSDLPGAVSVHVRAQDRDELARAFTEHNARRNGLSAENLRAYAEPLLAGTPPGSASAGGDGWDFILANIPAKAGKPVLKDFIRRSAALLNKDGLVFLVAVHTLAEFFRSCIAAAGAPLIAEETGSGHTVFAYRPTKPAADPTPVSIVFDETFPRAYPFYIRNQSRYEMEGISYRMDTVHGAPDFDSPSGAIQAAVKLAAKLDLVSKLRGTEAAALHIHDSGQGHFALWLAHCLGGGNFRWVLSGRNALALANARSALMQAKAAISGAPAIIPAADIFSDRARIAAAAGGGFELTGFFPEKAADAAWEGLTHLAAPGGFIIASMASAEAERFDRKKPPRWRRLGDIKRKGFRALAYQAR